MCTLAGHTKCKGHIECTGSQEGFQKDYLSGAHARFPAQVCTIGHTCTGSCICSKSDGRPYPDVNPECPVAGHSATVVSVDFSPDGKHFVSGSHDKVVKIWGTETGAEVSKFWDFVVFDEVMGVVTAVVPSRVCPGSRLR